MLIHNDKNQYVNTASFHINTVNDLKSTQSQSRKTHKDF